MTWSIFTHTKAGIKKNSSYLHRYDVAGDERMALIAQEELLRQGHEIYECMENGPRGSSSRRQTRSAAPGTVGIAAGGAPEKRRR